MMIDSTEIEAFIKTQGWLSFGIVSISEVEIALHKHKGIFDAWLKKGFQAEMDYLENMKADRYHPKNKLPEAMSVMVLAAWYGVPKKGNVARYARGKDYHKVLKKKLLALSDWLKAKDSRAQTYISVDSGPTVDRVLAEAAGLGFFGKNANIIAPSRGSYFFIASLTTNLELPTTKKHRMPNCGNCTKCISACPTGAIVAPGVIDARKCISYLTIENKGGIPESLRLKIGDRLFGCDICQEVCPFNEGRAYRQEVFIDELKDENGVGTSLNVAEILALETDAAFQEYFAGTPLMRAKRLGLLRNACVVAGNSKNPRFLPLLQEVLKREKSDMIKENARWALSQLQA